MERSSADKATPYAKALSRCTIRARVAFVLAIAERAYTTIETNATQRGQIRNALDLAQRWQDNAYVSGDSLYEAVVGDAQEMLAESAFFFFTPDSNDPRTFAWSTIISAMFYISWHAYGRRGRLPEPIADVEEEDIDHTVKLALRIPNFNGAAIERLARYCIRHYRSPDGSDLGEPISAQTMLEAADWDNA